MNLKVIMVVIAVVILIITGAFFAGLLPGLDMMIDTNTQGYEWTGGHPVVGQTTPELTDEVQLVTSWQAGESSVKLGMQGRAKFPNCNNLGHHEFSPCRYYYKVYLLENSVNWNDAQLIMWHENYNRDLIHLSQPSSGFPDTGGHMGHQFDDINYQTAGYDELNEEGIVIGKDVFGMLGNCGSYTTPMPVAYNIELKGPHVGVLRVEYWVTVGCAWWPGYDHVQPIRFQRDEVKLLSGVGDVKIVGEQSVYEEGQTITFEVDTDFSGTTQGGEDSDKGWELRVYNANGDCEKTWDIGDNKRNLEKSYVIPDDAYNPSGSNTWKVELWNTLFNQCERYFFTIGEGMYEQIPGKPVITFSEVSYDMGDTVYVTLQSDPNPEGTNKIHEFFVKAYYGTSGVDYVSTDFPKYVAATGDSATISFTATRGDRYITVEANAFDGPHNVGGLSSETGINSVYIKDKNPEPDTFTLNVYVRAGTELISDADVKVIGDKTIKTGTTDHNGKAIIPGLPQDTYEVIAEKDGVGRGTDIIVLVKDDSLTIYLTGINWLGVAICVVIAIIALAIAYFTPGMHFKLLVAALGIVLAVIVYWYWFM